MFTKLLIKLIKATRSLGRWYSAFLTKKSDKLVSERLSIHSNCRLAKEAAKELCASEISAAQNKEIKSKDTADKVAGLALNSNSKKLHRIGEKQNELLRTIYPL